jgi:hypothetical protein
MHDQVRFQVLPELVPRAPRLPSNSSNIFKIFKQTAAPEDSGPETILVDSIKYHPKVPRSLRPNYWGLAVSFFPAVPNTALPAGTGLGASPSASSSQVWPFTE